jgi:hypothetical protein
MTGPLTIDGANGPLEQLLLAVLLSNGLHLSTGEVRVELDFLHELRAANYILTDTGIDPTNGIYRTYTLTRKATT